MVITKEKIMKKAENNIYEKNFSMLISIGKMENEIKAFFGNDYKFSHQKFVDYRKALIPEFCRKKAKNPNLQIRLNDFKTLEYLRNKYNFYIGYDGIDITAKEKAKYLNFNNQEIWFNSFIKFEIHKKTDKSNERIKTFINFHELGSHSEKLEYIEALYEKVLNWMLKQEKTENREIYEKMIEMYDFYIVADKHRAIVSFLNSLKQDSFISSNPTTLEKHENFNKQLKTKAFLSNDFNDFKAKNPNIECILTKSLLNTKNTENIELDIEIDDLDNLAIIDKKVYNENYQEIVLKH